MVKEYYLPQGKAIVIGIFLVLVSLCPVFITMMSDEHHSVIAGLQFFAEAFTSFPEIIVGIICLVILTAGLLYLINSNKIVRVRLDDAGIHYLPIGEGHPSKGRLLFSLFYYKTKLQFIAYSQIARAQFVQSKWQGSGISLHLRNGEVKQLLGATVPAACQQEVVEMINSRIN